MKSKRYESHLLFLSIAVSLVVMTWGCKPASSDSGLQLGAGIPVSEPATNLADIMENPSKYNGKKIVMNGFVSGQCASLCKFYFKDGVHTVTIYPEGFKFPKLEHDKKVTLYSQVVSGEERIVFSALGLKMK